MDHTVFFNLCFFKISSVLYDTQIIHIVVYYSVLYSAIFTGQMDIASMFFFRFLAPQMKISIYRNS